MNPDPRPSSPWQVQQLIPRWLERARLNAMPIEGTQESLERRLGAVAIAQRQCADELEAALTADAASLEPQLEEGVRCPCCGVEAVAYQLVEWSDPRCRKCWGGYLEASKEIHDEQKARIAELEALTPHRRVHDDTDRGPRPYELGAK